MIGSTRRKSGLNIPPEWEMEFRKENPISNRIAEGIRLSRLLASALARAKENEQTVTDEKLQASRFEGQSGPTERRSG